jgi:hypothetical protein
MKEPSPGNPRLFGLSLAGLALLGAGVAAVLFFFDPARVGIYPVCYFHRITGLQCPGCGGLRAAHQLLHGNILAALHLNAFAVLAVPVFAWLCLRFAVRAFRRQPGGLEVNPCWLWAGLVVLVVFGIVRNFVGW